MKQSNKKNTGLPEILKKNEYSDLLSNRFLESPQDKKNRWLLNNSLNVNEYHFTLWELFKKNTIEKLKILITIYITVFYRYFQVSWRCPNANTSQKVFTFIKINTIILDLII